jgi:DNA topoisomerase-2
MAFSKKRVEDRKDWLRSYVPGTFLDHSADTIGYRDFVHKELILFSRADLERSIPSMVDGLKPGQRKIIFSCFKRNLHSDIKVAQLAGYVAEHSAYHHGETSLATTIVGLAQNFVGSNNVNYLVPQGQFGTRIHGGKDAASARYIFTRLAALARHLFHQADDPLLKYLNEEGQSIEPEWYMPILPTVLLNGAEGIGTGWSTSIPNYDPRDIVDNLKALLEGKEMFAMDPWYRGFKGTIQEIPQNSKGGRSYLVSGIIRQLSDTTLEITELPIRKWTQDYKEFLEEMAHPEDKNATPFITEYKEYHTDDTVRFVVELPAAHMQEALAVGLHNKFKLTTKISIGNMMLFGADGIIRRYVNPEDIIREFYQLRLDFYRLRKDLLLRISRADLVRISNKVKFILEVVSGSLKLGNRKRADVDAELESRGYDRLPTSAKFKPASVSDDDTTADTAADTAGDNDNGKLDAKVSYEYLLSMPLGSLTLERVEALRKEASEAAAAVERLEATSEADMWRTDLDAFLQAYDEMEEEDARHEAVLASQRARAIDAERKRHAKNKGKKGNAKNGKGKKIKSRDAWSSSDGDEYDEDDDGFEDDGLEAPRIYVQRTVKERRPAPPPQAPLEGSAAAAAGGASTSSSSSGPGAGAGNGNGRNRKGQPPAPQPPAKREEEMSLVERMAMRMGGLDLGATGVTAGVSETSSSTVALPLKRSTARKPQGKPKAKSKAKSKAHYEDEDEIEVESDASAEWTDIELSERERDLADAHMQPSNSTKVTQKTAKTAKPSSRTAKAPAVGKKAAKTTSKKGANKKKVQSGIDSDLVSDTDSDVGGASDDESAMAPQHIKALPKRPVRSREARPRAYVVDVDDDDDDASDVSIDESEEEYVPSD